MLNRLKIGTKITLVLFCSLLISLIGFSFFVYNSTFSNLKEKYIQELLTTNEIEQQSANIFFNDRLTQLRTLTDHLKVFTTEELQSQAEILEVLMTKTSGVKNLWVFNQSQELYLGEKSDKVYSTESMAFDSFNPYLVEENSELIFGEVYLQDNVFYIDSELLFRAKDRAFLVLKAQLDVSVLLQNFVRYDSLSGKETKIVQYTTDDKIQVVRVSPENNKNLVLNSIYIGEEESRGIQFVLEENKGVSEDIDSRGHPVLKSWKMILPVNWSIVSSSPVKLVRDDVNDILLEFFAYGLILLSFTVFLVYAFVRNIISPFQILQKALQVLSKGILPNKIVKKSNDEVGEMVDTVNALVKVLKKMVDFTKKIGDGKLDVHYKPLSDNDILNISLLNMRDSIRTSEARDNERNWIVSGVAEIGSILRKEGGLSDIGNDVLSYLTQRIDANQGAFYVVNESEYGEKELKLISSNAFNKKKYLKAKFKFAEGLIGQAAVEKETIIRTEIPEDYVFITSGLLGDVKPSCIMIIPLISEEKVYGVLEFAGFHKFEERQIKLCNEISTIIARTISNVKVNERTIQLLEESQSMSNELQENQIELNRNAEEMRVTQEELKFSNSQLEEQIEEVHNTQKRMQLLLENASEVITIFEKDGTVRYVSPSLTKILGYAQEEIVGTSYLENVVESGIDDMRRMFEELIEYPEHSFTIQYPYRKKNGETMWLEATGNNFMDDAAIKGILVNSRDITEKLRAEREERMRSKMQSLSENSPDLISRFDEEGDFFYINPMIEKYTGESPKHFLEQKIDDVNLPDQVKSDWLKLLEKVKETSNKERIEMNFASVLGERIMDVNAIPEFDANESLESVLFVAHDVTTRKGIERDIKNKNRKITESINYASRIQAAILPDYQLIRKSFPESFIFYEAKDVVSGDFPWYLEREGAIYLAAVDCTGHGVPGALMSLIGNFLLNNIIQENPKANTGEILDMLDEQVITTLKQNQISSTTKDGMDIALCRYDKKQNELQFSGAHRPLYLVQNNELSEIKGNRFSIGGGKAKNQTSFTTHKIEISPEDKIFISSDGYVDQFGGEKNRKIGSKKFRQLIQENIHENMVSQGDIFKSFWDSWKGKQKQTDDVLLMAFSFKN